MKKAGGILLLCMVVSTALFAQNNRKQQIKQRIYEEKVAFIKSQVPFTAEEERAFWPLYNDYNAQRAAVRDRFKDVRKRVKSGTEADCRQYNDVVVQVAEDEARLQSDFYRKLERILSAKKIYELFQAEKNFKKKLLDRVSEARNGL